MKTPFKGALGAFGLALQLAVVAPAVADDALLYRTGAVSTLPGKGDSWGFAALQPESSMMYIARRGNGLSIFDVQHNELIRTLDDSIGANAVAFAPDHNRAYAVNMDGSLSIIDLQQQKVLKRLPLDSGNLNNIVYDAAKQRMIITSGRRGDHSTIYFVNVVNDTVSGSTQVPAQKLDAPALLKSGTFIVPMRDENRIAVLTGPRLEHRQEWNFQRCSKPSALAVDEKRQRLFVACRGGVPVLVVADLLNGKEITTLPITRAVNAMAYDQEFDQLLVPSGADANLTVVAYKNDGTYQPLGSVGTSPWAHNMVFDSSRNQVYLFSAAFTQPAATASIPKPDPVFHADSFQVTTLKRQ